MLNAQHKNYEKRAFKFAQAIKYQKFNQIPYPYYKFIMMDVLHLNTDQIDALNYDDYKEALNYAMSMWAMKYNIVKKKPTTGSKPEKGGKSVMFHDPVDLFSDPDFVSKV